MARRKIKRRRGEGISITGPATIHVSRRVMLVIDAPREARVARLAKPAETTRPIRARKLRSARGPIPAIVEGTNTADSTARQAAGTKAGFVPSDKPVLPPRTQRPQGPRFH